MHRGRHRLLFEETRGKGAVPVAAGAQDIPAHACATPWLTMHAGSLLDGLIVHVADDLGASQENLTSLHRLATATDPDTDDVRLTLAQHVESSEAPVHREQKPAAAERLKAHQRLRLVMDGTPLPPDPYAATHPHDT